MLRRATLMLTLAALLAPRLARAEARPTVIAVFEIEDSTKRPKKLITALTDYLRVKLAEDKRLKVVDKGEQEAQLKKLVEAEKKQSYRSCVDNSCQIPLGKELAADKILRGKLSRFGKSYVLSVETIDLASGASAGAATDKSNGTEEGLMASVERIAPALSASLEPSRPPEVEKPVELAPAPPPVPVAQTLPAPVTVRATPPPETPVGATVMIFSGWGVVAAAYIFEVIFTLIKTDAAYIYYSLFPIVGPVLVDTYEKNRVYPGETSARGSNPIYYIDAGAQLLGAAVAVLGHVWALSPGAPPTATTAQSGSGADVHLYVGPGSLGLMGRF